MARRIAFVTGKLAEPAVRKVVHELAERFGFTPSICVLNISVAGLMTTDWVARRLQLPEPVDLIVLPGLCRGPEEVVTQATGIPTQKGPKDIWDLPEFFGATRDRPPDYGPYTMEILAEINHCPRLSWDQILRQAEEFRQQGADVIDLGCEPGVRWPELRATVQRLKELGFRVSVDTFDPWEAAEGARAGAELVLSVKPSTARLAGDWGCEVVAIPETPTQWQTLEDAMETLEALGVPYRVDPILEPIGFGFATSLGRYVEARRRWPQVPMLMGIGNVTELTDADSAAINVILAGFCQELGVTSVLTTAVINWARSSVRELDLARRLVYYAIRHKVLPKHLEPNLVLLRDPKLREPTEELLEDLQRRIKDPNFRIFSAQGRIHVFNNRGYWRSDDPFALFQQLCESNSITPSHAFYLGYEMCKAFLAGVLHKTYVQDEPLRWGFLTPQEKYGHPPENDKSAS
jgi:dihydropteroate synthase-like protein